VAASLLAELGYTEGAEPQPTRQSSPRVNFTPPKSPNFENKPPESPDYYPSGAEDAVSPRSRDRSPNREQELQQVRSNLLEAQSVALLAGRNLESLKTKFSRLRSRVIYLEGELAVYKRFAAIPGRGRYPPNQFPSYPPPPPPPRRCG